jgi:hypothetical protein
MRSEIVESCGERPTVNVAVGGFSVFLATQISLSICAFQVSNYVVRVDQLKNKSSRRVTYGNPCYSIGSKADSIYFLNDRSVHAVKVFFFKFGFEVGVGESIEIAPLM